MRPWERLRLVTAAALLLALAVALNARLEETARIELPQQSLYLPSGRYLEAASLGFRELVADVLYVWSIQYYSIPRPGRWRYLARFYDVITDLDPRFLSAYSIGAIILALEAGNPEASLRLLDKGIAANPRTFYLAFEAGFYARDMGRTDRAAEYFRIAKERPDAPAFVTRWYYVQLANTGDRHEALVLWKQLLAGATSEYERNIAQRYIRDLTREIDLERLRAAVAAFRAANGRLPRALGELGTPPLAPDGEPYAYDPATGDVKRAPSNLQERLQ